MLQSLIQPPGLNDLFRAAALLSLWPRCFDPSVEAYSANDPTA
jgi:hypothetical protein